MFVEQHPSWLPVDYAGKGIAEVVLSPHPTNSAVVYHIVNPNVGASWGDILAGLKAAGLEFETVDRTEWIQRLAKSDSDGVKNPTIKLLVSSFPIYLFLFFGMPDPQPNPTALLPSALRNGLSPADGLFDRQHHQSSSQYQGIATRQSRFGQEVGAPLATDRIFGVEHKCKCRRTRQLESEVVFYFCATSAESVKSLYALASDAAHPRPRWRPACCRPAYPCLGRRPFGRPSPTSRR